LKTPIYIRYEETLRKKNQMKKKSPIKENILAENGNLLIVLIKILV
jgi:hypothetical protein